MTDPALKKEESVHGTTLVCGCVVGRGFELNCPRHTVVDLPDDEWHRVVAASKRVLDEIAGEGSL